MKIAITLLKFLFLGSLFIVSNHNLALSEQESRDAFVDHFMSWMKTLFSHGIEITGYAVNSRWLPSNSTVPSVTPIFQSG